MFMMSIWHLAWIIPCSVFFGYALAAVLTIAGHCDDDRREWKDDEEEYEYED